MAELEAPVAEAPETQEAQPPKYKLWQSLNSAKYYTKSYDDFNKQFSTPDAVAKLHNSLSAAKYYTKSQDDFTNQFFGDTKKKSTGATGNGSQPTVTQLPSGGQQDQGTNFTYQALPNGVPGNPVQPDLAMVKDPHQKAIIKAQQQREITPSRQQPLSEDPKKERSIMDGVSQALYVPAIKQGFNDLIVSPAAGGTDFIDRTIDKAYQGITGEKTPDWLRKGGFFHDVSKQIQDEYDTRDKPTNIASSSVESVAGAIPLVASMFTGEGEVSLATKAPQLFGKLSKTLATTGALNAYKEATENKQGYAQSLGTAAQGAAKGGIEGQFMEAQMLVGGALGKGVANKLAEKGLFKGGKATAAILHALSVGTVFGGTSAGEDLLDGKDIDVDKAVKQFGTGLAFEIIPTAQGMTHEFMDKYHGAKINDKAAQLAATASSASNLNGESVLRTLLTTPTEQLVKINSDVPEGHEDLYANSIEQGAKAYETKDLSEKKNAYTNQLILKTQGDVKLLASKIAEDKQSIVDEVTNSTELSDEQKQDVLDKIDALSDKPEQSTENNNLPITPEKNENSNEKVGEQPQGQSAGQSRNQSNGEEGQAQIEEKVNRNGGDEPPIVKENQQSKTSINQSENEKEQQKTDDQGSQNEHGRERGNEDANQNSGTSEKEVKDTGGDEPPVVEKAKQKAIDAITHGIIHVVTKKDVDYGQPKNEKKASANTQPRVDLGGDFTTAQRNKAVNDIIKGNYDTAPAKRMIELVMDMEKDGRYPIIAGTGGKTINIGEMSPEDVQDHIDDAKAHKIGHLTKSELADANASIADLGITVDDIKAHEEYEQSRHDNGRTPANISEPVQESENDKRTGSSENKGSEASQGDGSEKIISRQNSEVDKSREKRGLPALFSEQAKHDPELWDAAMKRIDANPNEADDIIRDFRKSGRPLSDEDSAILLHKRISLENEQDRLDVLIADAHDAGKDIPDVQEQRQSVADQLQDLDRVDRETGTASGRSLRARQLAAKADFSLSRLELRKRAENGGRALTAEELAHIKDIHKEYQEKQTALEAKITELEDRERARAEKEALEDMKRQAKSERKSTRSSQRKQNRQDLVQDIRAKLKASRGTLSASPIPYLPELIKIAPELAQLAKSYIAEGVDKLDDIVDKIHEDIKDVFDGVEKRAIRDALSGYGQTQKMSQEATAKRLRELKAEARNISALEDIEQGDRPLKTGMQRDKPTDEVRNLQKRVREALKKSGIEVKTKDEYLKSALDAVKSRLKNQIADITRQIETGEKPPEKTQIQYDQEANDLKSQRDELKKQLDSVSDTNISEEQRNKLAIKAAERSKAEYERRVKENDTSSKGKRQGPDTPGVATAKQARDAAKQEYQALKDALNPKLTKEQIALKALKARTANQIAEYQRRLVEKDFSPKPPRTPIQLDPEAIKAKADLQRVKDDFARELEIDKLANRTGWEKGVDKALKYRRAELLLNLSGAAKVGMASAYRIVSQPLHEISGSVMRKIFPGVSAKAAREGHGFNVDAEWQALKSVWSANTLAEVKKKFKGKLDDIETNYGDKKEHFDINPILDLAGNIHSAEKEFAKQNEFRRSVILRTKWAQEHGIDTDSPLVATQIGKAAYEDAMRQVFMGDNIANKVYGNLMQYLEKGVKEEKFGKAGKIAATTLKLILPIVKVPTNYLLEKVQYTPVLGAGRAIMIMARGIEKMSPHEADYVMRVMKKQGLGAGLLAMGYFNPQTFGGFRVPGGKRDDSDPLKANDIKVFGVHIPHWMTHTPLLSILQMGATIRRAADKYDPDGIGLTHFAKGALNEDSEIATRNDLLESTPFYETPKDFIKAQENAKNTKQFIGNFLRGLIIPNFVSQIAEHYDKDSEGETVKRNPKSITEGIEMGIPGLRKNVQIKNPHPNFDKITIGNNIQQLSNDEVIERQKYYDEFMKSDGAKELKQAIMQAKQRKDVKHEKSLKSKLGKAASQSTARQLMEKHYVYDPQTGDYNWK